MKYGRNNPTRTKNRLFLLLELAGLFLGIPTLMYFWTPIVILPLLWIFAAWCGRMLLRDPDFDRADLWRAFSLRSNAAFMLIQFAFFGVGLFAIVYFFSPDLLFSLVKKKPLIWLLVMFLYPVFSVYPQELIYRAYFFHRYRALFPNKWRLIAVNALLFGYTHIIFQNWIAVGLTAAGGILFAVTYDRSKSTLLVSVMHSIFGCLIFTLGLGQFFYIGTVASIPPHLKI